MSYVLLGHCPKLGSRLSVLVWDAVLNDPFDPDNPSRQSRRREYGECWNAVLQSLVEADWLYLESLGIDLEDLWACTDHEELRDYLNDGTVIHLELVERGYFSATLKEPPNDAHSRFQLARQDADVRHVRRRAPQELALRRHPVRADGHRPRL